MTHPALPAGWTMVQSTEVVPPPPGIQPFFVRPTWNGYNAKGEWVSGSQSEDDCYNQLISRYQSGRDRISP